MSVTHSEKNELRYLLQTEIKEPPPTKTPSKKKAQFSAVPTGNSPATGTSNLHKMASRPYETSAIPQPRQKYDMPGTTI